MNILIKLTCLIGLVIAPILGGHSADHTADGAMTEEMVFVDEDGNETILTDKQLQQVEDADRTEDSKEVLVEMSSEGDVSTAEVTITTTKDGEATTETKVFTGTEEEVKEQVEAIKGATVKVEGGAKVEKKVVVEKSNG